MPSLQELIMGQISQGFQSGASGANALMEQEAKKKAQQEMLTRQLDEAKQLRSANPESNVNVEGVSISAKDPLTNLLRKQALENAATEKQEAALTKFGDRLTKSENPNMVASLAALEGATKGSSGGILTDPNYQVKSGAKTNLLRSVPLIGGMLASGIEKLGLNPAGTEQEAQALQRLRNIDIKKLSGSAVSRSEEGRQNIEKGISSGDEEAIKRGVAMMRQASDMESQNIKGSTRPEVLSQYKQRGGQFELSDLLGAMPKQQVSSEQVPLSPEQRKARIAELRKKLGQ